MAIWQQPGGGDYYDDFDDGGVNDDDYDDGDDFDNDGDYDDDDCGGGYNDDNPQRIIAIANGNLARTNHFWSEDGYLGQYPIWQRSQRE